MIRYLPEILIGPRPDRVPGAVGRRPACRAGRRGGRAAAMLRRALDRPRC
jgi:hypothetical protein